MKRRGFVKFSLVGVAGLFATTSYASGGHDAHAAASGENLGAVANKMYHEILKNNEYYVKNKGGDFFKKFIASQAPRATIVGCSDSRFQASSLDATPENDLFVIRNIGNQYTTNEGSVGYGVVHLHTPLLIIVGHTRCGAIKAALSDYTEEDSPIRQEVDNLSLSIRRSVLSGTETQKWAQAVAANVHQQVNYCTTKFADRVESGSLTVVGVIYDLANDLGKGYGKIHTININGEKDPAKLSHNPLVH